MSAREPTVITLSLAAGETSAFYNAGGDRVFVVESDQSTFEVQLDGEGAYVPLGLGINPAADNEFKRVKFKNTNGSALTATIVVSFWTYSDTRTHFAGAGLPVTVENATPIEVEVTNPESYPSTITPSAVSALGGANSLDIAAAASRKLLIIYNDNATNTVWWRDQAATTSIGVPIGPKQTLQVAFTGASRVRNNSGTSCDIYVTELT